MSQRDIQQGEASPYRDAGAAMAAVKTLRNLGYTYNGGEVWKPPLGDLPTHIAAAEPAEAQPASCPRCRALTAKPCGGAECPVGVS